MLTPIVKNKLRNYKNNNLLRNRIPFDERTNKYLYYQQQPLINFSSNDYLGLSTHPLVKKAFIDGVQQYGLGSGSSTMISGYFKPQRVLEEKFAEYTKREQAILFNSGYHANLGVIQAVTTRNSHVLLDKLCHASIIDGIRLSQCQYNRYRHCDSHHAKEILEKISFSNLLITESIFSMSGDIAPVGQLLELAKKNHMLFMVDDAHGFGVTGKFGGGICDTEDLNQDAIDCLVTPLGKAFGSIGALVSGKQELMEVILQFARTYTYTTALPPAIISATLASLEIMRNEYGLREKLHDLIRYFIKKAKERNILLNSIHLTPIKTIPIGNNYKVIEIQNKLINRGFFVSCIRTPTVPKNEACIRISLNCNHTENDIEQLLDLIYECLQYKI